ncbi:MAG TPA: SLBB domain-containing protein [Gemmatimonadaceae bacterium]
MSRLRVVVAFMVATRLSAQGIPRAECRPGDAVLLQVTNEPTLTDTFTVTQARSVLLPAIGEVSLADVDRDSLTPYFERVLSRYLRHPMVRARVMVRIGVVGEVAKPGFYLVPVDAVFANAVMLAGGPTKDAKVRDMYVLRDKETVLSAAATRAALSSNETVAQTALQSGDLVTVPRAAVHDTETWVRIATMLVTIPVALITIAHFR